VCVCVCVCVCVRARECVCVYKYREREHCRLLTSSEALEAKGVIMKATKNAGILVA
jgi:hypothetical protein